MHRALRAVPVLLLLAAPAYARATPIAEPSSWAVVGSALAGLGLWRRRPTAGCIGSAAPSSAGSAATGPSTPAMPGPANAR